MATPSFHLFPFLIRLSLWSLQLSIHLLYLWKRSAQTCVSGLTITHLQELIATKLISPGENIPSNEEQSQSRQQESWSLHLIRFEINI